MHIAAEVGSLIGANSLKVTELWQTINSRGAAPYTVMTTLRWVINIILRGTTTANQEMTRHTVSCI